MRDDCTKILKGMVLLGNSHTLCIGVTDLGSVEHMVYSSSLCMAYNCARDCALKYLSDYAQNYARG